MKRVLLRGPSLTQSGYGVHCRQIAAWLLSKENIDVRFQALPWGDTPWILDQNSNNGLVGKIMKNTVDPTSTGKFDVSFQLQLPNEWDSSLASYNVGMSAVVETDICNPQWIECCNNMDAVVVPSKHAESCLNKSGTVKKPLHVIPEAYCREIDEVKIEENSFEKFPQFSTPFNFLIFGQVTGDNPLNDRKNIFFTIKWLCEAFADDKSVGIVIKTNVGRNTQIDKRKTHDLMRLVLKECRKNNLFPKIHVLHGEMSEKDVALLYKHPQIKGLVSLTRGEGYGLPILEAAASGLPVIATGWSGHTDFLNHGKYINISYSLKEIHQTRVDGKIFVQGSKWAETDEEDFKKKIVKFKNNPTTPKEWSSDLSTIMRKKYSHEAIFSMYNEIFKEIL